MKNKVVLSFYVSQESRKILKKMAIDEDKTMAALIEEMIIIKWKQIKADKRDGTI